MIKRLLSKFTALEKIFIAATLALLVVFFFVMVLPWLRCPLCQGLNRWNDPCLWSPSTGALVLLSDYVTDGEDRQWEYGRPPLLQETYPSRRTAVIRLPAHTDAPPPFCAQHRDLGFPNRSFMLSVVEDSGFTITRALDDREENILSTPQGTVTLTPVFDREQDCWELELRW